MVQIIINLTWRRGAAIAICSIFNPLRVKTSNTFSLFVIMSSIILWPTWKIKIYWITALLFFLFYFIFIISMYRRYIWGINYTMFMDRIFILKKTTRCFIFMPMGFFLESSAFILKLVIFWLSFIYNSANLQFLLVGLVFFAQILSFKSCNPPTIN